MTGPRGRRRYVSLLRKRTKANWRDLKSAASRAKFNHSFLRKHRMRLRQKNSFQASKLSRSLRSSSSPNHGSKVRSLLHSFDSPETLTKKGKISRVSERSIDKVSSTAVAQGEKEEGDAIAVDRRMTRGMDGEEVKRTMTIDALRSRNFKGSRSGKFQKPGKRLKWAGLKNRSILKETMKTDNASHRMKVKIWKSNSTENKEDKRLHRIADSAEQGYGSKCLSRLDTNQASKSSSQARALLKSSGKQKRLMSGGVTTRQKANLTAQVQRALDVNRETKWGQRTKGNHSLNSVNHSSKEGFHGVEDQTKRPISRGRQEETEDRFYNGDARQSACTMLNQTINSELDSEDLHKGAGSSALSERSRKRKTVNESDDATLTDIGKGRFPQIATEHALTKLNDSAKKLRRSKRKRSPSCSNFLIDHRVSQTGSKGAGGQVEDVSSQDAVIFEHGNDAAGEHLKSAHRVAELETESNGDVCKMDPTSKSCLVATNPAETGGRQMRPRPLDLEQPLLVLVEGLDEDYYELDGGLFHRMLQQQPELKSPLDSQAKSNKSNRKALHSPDATGEKAESIVIPSFRICMEPEDSSQHPSCPYILPGSYIKAGFTTENHQAEYDMDDEDEEWLNKYNQSLSPSSTLSVDQFERIIDLLEIKAAEASGISSITESLEEDHEPVLEECCICNGGENSANNPVYQCKSCHILVHQSCYGLKKGWRREKKRPKWNCKKCEAVAEGKVPADICCSLCYKQGGALKPSTEPHRWAHVVCALYTNETYFVNPDAMEPIDGLNAADARAKRQRRQCWLCGVREGSVERCSVPGCKSVFHVSCGVIQGASFELQHSNQQVTSVRVYCPRHAFEVFGSAKGRSSEGEKGTFSQKSVSQEGNFFDAEKVSKAGKHSEISPARQGKKETRSQGKNHGWSEYDHNKENRGTSKDDHSLFSITEKGSITQREQGERKDAQLMKGTAMNGVSVEKACEMLAGESIPYLGETNPNLMEGVYLYWVSKREKQGGPLLHRIQQEHAAKQFGIFNSDDESGPATDSVSDGSSLKYNVVDMKMDVLQNQELLEDTNLEEAQRILREEFIKIGSQDLSHVSQEIIEHGLEGPPLSYKAIKKLCPNHFVRDVLFCTSSHHKETTPPKLSNLQHTGLARTLLARFMQKNRSLPKNNQVAIYFVQQCYVQDVLRKMVDWDDLPANGGVGRGRIRDRVGAYPRITTQLTSDIPRFEDHDAIFALTSQHETMASKGQSWKSMQHKIMQLTMDLAQANANLAQARTTICKYQNLYGNLLDEG